MPIVGERKAVIITVMFSLLLLGSISGIAFASSDNWVEVARFEGNESTQTESFTCDHVEWRIRWEYVPSFQPTESIFFSVFTYPREEGVRGSMYVNSIIEIGSEKRSGTSYIHDYQSTFFMIINVIGTENYTIIVEQNIDSIPEFPSWIIFPIFLTATLIGVIYKKRMIRLRAKF